MSRNAVLRAARAAALAMVACLSLAPARLAAQRGSPREAVIYFGRESDGGDGYDNARISVSYQFADCVGDVAVLYAMDRSSIWTSGTYYYRGKSYQVPAGIAAPRLETVVFKGPILNAAGQFVGSFSDPYTQGGAGAGCIGQSKVVFSRKEKLGDRSTQAEYASFLESLWIKPETQPRLRHPEMERWIGQQLAQQRDDSLAKVAEWRDRQRRDSLAREKAREDDAREAHAADSARRTREEDDARRRDSTTASEERDEREHDREQEAADREAATQRAAASDEQTARLQVMFAAEKLEWERAEEAYARGDFATARPLYEELAGSLVYGAQAKARLDTLNQQAMAEGLMAIFSLIGQLNHALSGTGMTAGAVYSQTGFPGDKGTAGATFTYVSGPMQRWIPYVDFTFGLGNDESKARRFYPSHSFGDLVVGTTVPKLKLPLGAKASLSPHFGWRGMTTDERFLNVGQTGLMLVAPGTLLRVDAVFIDGKPQLGGGIARIF